MKKKTKISIVIISIILVGIIFGTIDYYRAKDEKTPLFAINIGKSAINADIYVGLGYTVTKCPELENTNDYMEDGIVDFHLIMLFAHACFIENDDTALNDVYNKIGEYFGDENADRSNLASNHLDTTNNVVVVELIDNSKEKQGSFFKNAKIDSKYSKYIKFEQGGPYYTLDKCNSDGLKIITGEIKEINNPNYKRKDMNLKGTIIINIIGGLSSEDDIVFYHNSNAEFKIGQKVKVGYGGDVDYSNPPQAFAECIELLQ